MRLRTKFILIILASMVLLCAIFLFYIKPDLEKKEIEQVVNNIDVQLQHIDFFMEEFVNDTMDDITFLLTNEEIYSKTYNQFTNYLNVKETGINFDPNDEEEKIIEVFSKFIDSKPQTDFLYLAYENGAFVMNVPLQDIESPKENLFNYDPRTRPWYKEAMRAGGELILTEPYKSPSGYSFFLTAAASFEDTDNNTHGVLGIDLNILELADYLVKTRAGEPGTLGMIQRETSIVVDEAGNVDMIDNDVRVLGRINKAERSKDDYIIADDELFYLYESETLPWKFYVSIPYTYVENAVLESFITYLATSLGLIALVLVVLVIFVQKYILTPISTLTEATTEIAKTGKVDKLLKVASNDEVGQMASAFNLMIKELKAYQSDLEEKVQERTIELEENKSFMNALIDNSPQVIYVKDINGRYILVNKLWSNIFGFEQDQVVGKTFKEIIGHDDFTFIEYDHEVIRTKRALQIDDTITIEGIERDFVEVKFPITDPKGNVQAICGIATDISEHKEIQREIEKLSRDYKNFLESTSDLVYLKDEKLRYIASSKPLTNLLGYDDWNDVLGKTEEEVQNNRSKIRFNRAPELKVLNNDEVLEITEDIIYVGDEKGWVNTVKKPLKNNRNQTVGILSISRDITDMIRMNDALKDAKNLAESATKAKSDFLANMSHEIRTPMNAIIGLGGLLERTKLNIKQHDYIEKINMSARNLLGIINDILDFSKIEAGKLDIEYIPFNFDEVLNNLASVISLKAYEKGIEFAILKDHEIPEQLIGDPLRLNQILLNLSNNAVKFTEEGEVVLHIEVVNQYEDELKLRFIVKDTGIGMTEEQVEQLFSAFTQADASITRKYGGTGLGLTISKKLLDLMKGNISVESSYGFGTSFIFEMPFKIGEASAIKLEIVPESLKELKIAVIEDNETAISVYESYLEIMPKKVNYYRSGEAFLEDWEDGKFDLLLMDYHMPGINGIETWNQLKTYEVSGILPTIIMVTAYGKEVVINEATQSGIDSILMKPVTRSTLFDSIIQTLVGNDLILEKKQDKQTPLSEIVGDLVGTRILLVEDNLINQQVASENLVELGIEIDIANHGKEAVEMVMNPEIDYDLVLMDLQMPIMDGMTATREIRKHYDSNELPIIALSADVMAETVRNIHKVGMQEHVAKPIDLKELVDKIALVLGLDTVLPETLESAGPVNVSLKEFKTIQVEKALKKMGGNERVYQKVLKGFSENYTDFRVKLEEVMNKGIMEDSVRYFHTLKGVAGSIGQDRASELAMDIEESLINGVITPKNVLESEVLRELEKTLKETIQEINIADFKDEEITVSNEKIHGNTELKEQLNQLKELIESYDTVAEDVLIELRGTFIESGRGQEWKSLYKAIKDYDFDDALSNLTDIMNKMTSGES